MNDIYVCEVIKLKVSKLILTLVVLAVLITAGVAINITVYDYFTPFKSWVHSVTADVGSASGSEARAGQTEEAKDADKEKGSSDEKSARDKFDQGTTVSDKSEDPNEGSAKPKSTSVTDANKPADPNQAKVAEPNKPGDPNAVDSAKVAEPNKPTDANTPVDPNKMMEALNLKDVEMKDIIAKISDWTGMVIIPSEDVMKQKITIYSPTELPRKEALEIIYAALRAKGFVAEQTMPNMISLKPIQEAALGSVPTISPDVPLASIENKNQIVQKFFKMENYSPVQMSQVIYPLVGKHGYVSADENTGDLQIIDTVENLLRFERMIDQFDVPESEKTVTEVFEIRNGDPAEIVQLIEMLMGEGINTRSRSRDRLRRYRDTSSLRGKRSGGSAKPNVKGGEAMTVTIESVDIPIVLIPEPSRKWIIAKGSVEDIELIRKWIIKLDRKEALMAEYETVKIQYADIDELVDQVSEAVEQMPGSDLEASVLIQGLEESNQIVIYGRKDLRDVIKQLILEIDVPSGDFETKVFKLKHADAQEIKTNLEGLYETQSGYTSSYSRGRYRSRSVDIKDTIKVVAFPTRQEVTVIASPENLAKITEQIAEWDVAIDPNSIKPRIIELKNSDPMKLAELLTSLFSAESRAPRNWYEAYFGRDEEPGVGPLYGKMTFEAVPDTRKILVISEVPEGYAVAERMIKELDTRDKAEVPKVITLKYADAEELCDQLNAILNEPGTRATIRRRIRGLSQQSVDSSGNVTSEAGTDQSSGQDEIVPWWSGSGARSRTAQEMPISNIIGRIRFIPVHRSKAVLVLSPPEYIEDIQDMIEALDQPGKQVMVKAIIVQVNHSDMTSLGIKIASDPTSFGQLSEGAITTLSEFAYQENRGAFSTNLSGAPAQQGVSTMFDLSVLIDLLVKETQGRVLNEPTLWMKDNEEAEFFRGQEVSFIESDKESSEGISTQTQFTRADVGVRLRVRPNITPEKDVDMTLNLEVTQLEQETINTQPVTSKLDTTTHLIVGDGETIMLGGILFRNESDIEQKVPLIGDLPLIGPFFRHYDVLEQNTELLVFITPFVVDAQSAPTTVEQMEISEKKLGVIIEQLHDSLFDEMIEQGPQAISEDVVEIQDSNTVDMK